jgi:hypothetical protein
VRPRSAAVSVLFTALLLSTSALTAAAATPIDSSNPDSIAATVKRLAPAAGVSADTSGRISLPSDSSSPVVLERGVGSNGTRIALGLPDTGVLTRPRMAADGTATFSGGSNGAAVAVQEHGDGVRVLVVIESAAAPTEYRFVVDLPAGARMTQLADASIVVTQADGSFLGGFEPAWAKDSSGRSSTISCRRFAIRLWLTRTCSST